MKPIQSELKAWMKKNENFQTNYQNIRKEVLEDPSIKHFLSSHPELTSEVIDKHLIKLYEYKSQSKQCERCKSLGGCQNMIQGYSPVLGKIVSTTAP